MNGRRSPAVGASALAVVLALAGAATAGCGNDLDDSATAPQLESSVPDVRGEGDLTDVYTGDLDQRFVEDLPAYEDQEVTVRADVAEVLAPGVFSVTSPSGPDVEPVLVVATTAVGDLELASGDEVVVAATPAGDLEPDAVVQAADGDLTADQLEEWEDDTYLVASIVEPAP